MNETSFNTDAARSVLENLEALKKEHHFLLSSSIDNEKRKTIEISSESIDLGIDEVSLIIQLEKYFEYLRSETIKLDLQVQRLAQENNWLRDELTLTDEHLKISLEHRADYEREIESLNQSLASTTNENETLKINNDIDIDKEFPVENNERSSTPPNVKNHTEIPARFRTLHNLVIQYAQAGRYEVAVPLCRQALEDLEKTHGHSHPDVATMLNILALVYRDQNKFKEALELLNEALVIREKTLGEDHPAVAATLNNLAVLYGKKNRYKDAEPLCKRALEIREKYFGHDHPDVAKQLNNLALLCLNQGKYDQVEDYYKRAIEIYRKHFGSNDVNLLKTKNNLASAYLREGKLSLAFKCFHQILIESNENSAHSTIVCFALKNLGAICRRQQLQEQADELDSCLNRYASKSCESVGRALKILSSIPPSDEIHPREPVRRPPPPSPSIQDYGRLRRSGSFQKLRQSIRRGSEKLVQKLRGTPSNQLPTMHSMQFSTNTEPIKRASSMSVLNQFMPFPLQQQQTNRNFLISYTNHGKQSSTININRDHLTSTENLH